MEDQAVYETRETAMKKCRICQEVKPLSEFVPNGLCRNGVEGKCKQCKNDQQRKRNAKQKPVPVGAGSEPARTGPARTKPVRVSGVQAEAHFVTARICELAAAIDMHFTGVMDVPAHIVAYAEELPRRVRELAWISGDKGKSDAL